MMWWFAILAVSAGLVLWAGIAMYLRVRAQMSQRHGDRKHVSDVDGDIGRS